MASSWFVVKTKPRNELRARVVLQQRGIEVYLPEIPTRLRRGERTIGRSPLFPGYMFVRLEIATPDWIAARSAPGVAYLLGNANSPSPLPDALVDEIRVRLEERQRLGWRPAFNEGDRITIENGPFSGLEAVFDRLLSPRGRVRVFLQVLNRIVPVDLDFEDIGRQG